MGGIVVRLRVKEEFVPIGVEWRGRAKDLVDLPDFDFLVTRIKEINPDGGIRFDFAEGPEVARIGDWVVLEDGGDWTVWTKEQVRKRYNIEYPVEQAKQDTVMPYSSIRHIEIVSADRPDGT